MCNQFLRHDGHSLLFVLGSADISSSVKFSSCYSPFWLLDLAVLFELHYDGRENKKDFAEEVPCFSGYGDSLET